LSAKTTRLVLFWRLFSSISTLGKVRELEQPSFDSAMMTGLEPIAQELLVSCGAWIPEPSATGLREADLNVREQGLE
jgi:hypothetical protein